MIRINLLPVPKARKQEALIIQAVAGVVILVVVAVVCYFVTIQKKEINVVAQQRNEKLKQDIERLKAQVGEVEKYKQQMQVLQDQISVIRNLEKGRTGPVKMLDELTDLTPRHLWITSFKENQKRLSLDGYAESGMIIADFLDNLKASRFFQGANLVVVSSAEQEGQPVHKFTITASVKYDL